MSTSKILGSELKEAAEVSAKSVLESYGSLLKETKTGSWFYDKLAKDFLPQADRLAASKRQGGVAADKALGEARKEVFAQIFGSKKQMLIPIMKGIEQESTPAMSRLVADSTSIFLREPKDVQQSWRNKLKIGPSPYKPPQVGERAINRAAQFSFLSRVSIPHMGQVFNNTLNTYTSSFIKGMGEFMMNPKQAADTVLQSGAFEHDVMFEAKQMASGASKLERMLTMPGFKFERKWYTVISALTGKHSAITAARALAEDQTDKMAMSELFRLGIDPKKVLERGLDQNDIMTAMYRQADDVMFINRGLTQPEMWERSMGTRFVTKYKQYYFSQGKFVKDAIKEGFKVSWAEGARRVGILATIFPAVGWMTRQAQNFVTGNQHKPQDNLSHGTLLQAGVSPEEADPASEYIDMLAHYGGFGVAYNIAQSAKHNGMADFFAGPYFGTMSDISNDVFNMRGRTLGRTALQRGVPIVGPALAKKFFPPLKRGRRR